MTGCVIPYLHISSAVRMKSRSRRNCTLFEDNAARYLLCDVYHADLLLIVVPFSLNDSGPGWEFLETQNAHAAD